MLIGIEVTLDYMRDGEIGDAGKLWKENAISREIKGKLYEIVVTLIAVVISQTWLLSAQEGRKLEVREYPSEK